MRAVIAIAFLALPACAHSSPPPAAIGAEDGLTEAQCTQLFGTPHIPPTLVDLAGWSARRGVPTDCGEDRVVRGLNGDGECTAGPVDLDGAPTRLAIRVRAIDGELFVLGISPVRHPR